MTTLDSSIVKLRGKFTEVHPRRIASPAAYIGFTGASSFVAERVRTLLPLIIGTDTYDARDAARSLWVVHNENERAAVAEWAWIARQCGVIGPGVFGEFLAEAWKEGRRGGLLSPSRGWPRSEVVSMFEMASPEAVMFDNEHDAFAAMPDILTVYRGTSGITQAAARWGMSWTTEEATAAWFANRNDGFPLLLRANVTKSNVLAYFLHENEIVVRPGSVCGARSIPVTEMRHVSWKERVRLIGQEPSKQPWWA